MAPIERHYIGGVFVAPLGRERFALHNPATGLQFGEVVLGDERDIDRAVAAAAEAFVSFSRTTPAERAGVLAALETAVAARREALTEAMVLEFGAPIALAGWMADHAASVFADMRRTLREYAFVRPIGIADVVMTPLGVTGLITPWNGNASAICGKLAAAIAAGCTSVVKPSELSAHQTDVLCEAFAAAGLAPGLVNIVTGRGEVAGAALAAHPGVAKLSFTGSTAVGKAIAREAVSTMKRVTLELGGKSPVLVLDDADLASCLPLAVQAGFMNSGQACVAGTRLLVPRAKRAEIEDALVAICAAIPVGDPRDPATAIGPLVSQRQWDRVEGYIGRGVAEGAELLAGGEGRPDGLTGWFVRPTVFGSANNAMTIAREEIFGPVIALIAYDGEEEAISIANDSDYGLQAYVFSSDPARARRVAERLDAGRVLINTLAHEPDAPFGGFKQSGIGREFGSYGLEAFLEPKAIIGVREAMA
ncbi:aldehyde dehydrogenase family protein [Novosphingobium sp. Gsoil 351]|uniref:aldehyde dehydrogenase family protein n=1 Tax=Novosphingobium sp. Gsoil 351 TaxID=2675225 RepID=UPI0012B4E4E3|nr:aldehyde dehydrogenase family protein [Novosphingobium sp. Gsoil 351]QGN53464.1 aldehyde dehydrogenase family protein [Novosphingobium sp. Gsoil 351]